MSHLKALLHTPPKALQVAEKIPTSEFPFKGELMLSLSQAAQMLKISRPTLRQKFKQGELAGVRHIEVSQTKHLFNRLDLIKWYNGLLKV